MQQAVCTQCAFPIPATAMFCGQCGGASTNNAAAGGTTILDTSIGSPSTQILGDSGTSERTGRRGEGLSGLRPVRRECQIMTIDESGSMSLGMKGGMTRLDAAKHGARNLVLSKSAIDDQDSIGLVGFCEDARVLCPPSVLRDQRADTLRAIETLEAGGGTCIGAGLAAALNLFDWNQTGVVRRITLLSDGWSDPCLKLVEETRQRGVIVDVIGIGETPDDVDEKLLRHIASTVDGEKQYRFFSDARMFVTHMTSLAEKTQIQ